MADPIHQVLNLLTDAKTGLGEKVSYGTGTGDSRGVYVDKGFVYEELAKDAAAGMGKQPKEKPRDPDKPMAEVQPHEGKYYIKLLNPDAFNDSYLPKAREALATARRMEGNRLAAIEETVADFTEKLKASQNEVTRNGDTLKLGNDFAYEEHAKEAIEIYQQYNPKLARPVPVTDAKTNETRYHIELNAPLLHEFKMSQGEEAYKQSIEKVAGAHRDDQQERAAREAANRKVAEAFGEKTDKITHRPHDLEIGFDKKANAQTIADLLNKDAAGAARVVEGQFGGKFYVRLDDARDIADENAKAAFEKAGELREQEKAFIKKVGEKFQEEIVEYKNDDLKGRQKEGSVGFRYCLREPLTEERAKKIAGDGDNIARVIPDGSGKHIVILNGANMDEAWLQSLTVGNVANVVAARDGQKADDRKAAERKAKEEALAQAHSYAADVAGLFPAAVSVTRDEKKTPFLVSVNTGLVRAEDQDRLMKKLEELSAVGSSKKGALELTIDAEKLTPAGLEALKSANAELKTINDENAVTRAARVTALQNALGRDVSANADKSATIKADFDSPESANAVIAEWTKVDGKVAQAVTMVQEEGKTRLKVTDPLLLDESKLAAGAKLVNDQLAVEQKARDQAAEQVRLNEEKFDREQKEKKAREKAEKENRESRNSMLNMIIPAVAGIGGMLLLGGGGISILGLLAGLALAGVASVITQNITKSGMFAEKTNAPATPAATPDKSDEKAAGKDTPKVSLNVGGALKGISEAPEGGAALPTEAYAQADPSKAARGPIA